MTPRGNQVKTCVIVSYLFYALSLAISGVRRYVLACGEERYRKEISGHCMTRELVYRFHQKGVGLFSFQGISQRKRSAEKRCRTDV
jgi:hypothetical protein